MATEPTNQAVVEDEVVTFDAKQQEKLDEIIRKATARAGSEARVAAEQARLEAKAAKEELEEAKAKLEKANTPLAKNASLSDIEALEAKLAEVRSIGETANKQLEDAQRKIQAKEAEIAKARQETMDLKKTTELHRAASSINFVKPDHVIKLTQDDIKWDATRGQFIVLKEDGSERMNSLYEPMSLKEYYKEYADENPNMVRGDVKGGTGSTASGAYDPANKGKYTVEQIFGKKSNSMWATKMSVNDPAEYQRLRKIAVSMGLL